MLGVGKYKVSVGLPFQHVFLTWPSVSHDTIILFHQQRLWQIGKQGIVACLEFHILSHKAIVNFLCYLGIYGEKNPKRKQLYLKPYLTS